MKIDTRRKLVQSEKKSVFSRIVSAGVSNKIFAKTSFLFTLFSVKCGRKRLKWGKSERVLYEKKKGEERKKDLVKKIVSNTAGSAIVQAYVALFATVRRGKSRFQRVKEGGGQRQMWVQRSNVGGVQKIDELKFQMQTGVGSEAGCNKVCILKGYSTCQV